MTVEIRPVSGMAELERFVAVRNEVFADDPENAAMLALVRASEPEHVDLGAYENGELVGTGTLAGDPVSLQSSHPYVEVTVPARHRGRGIGSALCRELAGHVRARGKDGVNCEAREGDDYSIGYLLRRGFVERGRVRKFVLDLAESDGADPVPPAGIELAVLSERPELLDEMYEVARLTHPEMGGSQARHADSFLQWQVYQLGNPRLALDMTTVALAGGRVVGFSTLIRGLDERTAEQRNAVVVPEWRRRGVATALLQAQIALAKRASLETLFAWERSGHEGRTYGAKLGFTPRSATIGFRGPLPE